MKSSESAPNPSDRADRLAEHRPIRSSPLAPAPLHQPLGLRLDERAVQQIQRLLRNRRGEAAAGRVRPGEVKCPKKARQVLAADKAVDRPAVGVRFVLDFFRATGLLQVKFPATASTGRASTQGRVGDGSSAQQPVRRISLGVLRVSGLALLVGGRQHNGADELLHRPAIRDKFRSQVIGRPGVTAARHGRRSRSVLPPVQQLQPNPVDHDSCGQRIVRRSDGPCHLQPSAIGKRLAFATRAPVKNDAAPSPARSGLPRRKTWASPGTTCRAAPSRGWARRDAPSTSSNRRRRGGCPPCRDLHDSPHIPVGKLGR